MSSPKFIGKTLTLGLTAAILMTSSAFAQAVNQAGADALKARFTQELNSRKNIKVAGRAATFTGETSVVAKDSYYQVTLPSLQLADQKDGTVNIGKIVMNMSPSDAAGNEWKSSVALPSTLTYSGANGKNPGTIKLGSQKASGLWDMTMFGFRNLNASYSDVVYQNTGSKDGTALGQLDFSYNITKSPTGISGPVTVNAKDLSFIDTAGNKSPLAQELKVNSQIQADKGAAQGFTQTSQAEITGLSNTVTLLGNKLKDPNQTNKAQIQKALGVVSVLQMSGKPVAGNADTRSYDVKTDGSGKTTLNGVDVSLLLGGIQLSR